MSEAQGRRRFLRTLSGRFLMLIVMFVALAEAMVIIPSMARYRADYLLERLSQAQIAALTQLASDAGVSPELERELLANAGVYNVVLRRDDVRQLVLSSPVPSPVASDYDLREAGPLQLIRDAVQTVLTPGERVVRVIGNPVQEGGELIEITIPQKPLREAMLRHLWRLFSLASLIAAVMSVLLFLAARRLILTPVRRVVVHMKAYAEAPEDARTLIAPSARVEELREAEEMMASMQHQLTGALRQKERLAQLGGAVAKISHDLRNILTTAQLFADRIEGSADPAVARSVPKLVGSISRAVSLCEATLAFGKAEEAPPQLMRFALAPLVAEVAEGEGLALNATRGGEREGAAGPAPGGEALVSVLSDIPPTLALRADREQLYRVLSNLIRNAAQAISATLQPGTIELSAGESEQGWWIRVGDTGPGLPPRAREHLFAAFQGGVRKGGTGLGLAISAELIRGHGGRIELLRSDPEGTEFMVHLPKLGLSADPQLIE